MHIVLFSQYFHPEVGATSNRIASFAHCLREAGHEVTVVCEFPNHPHGRIPLEYKGKTIIREEWKGIQIIRVWVMTSHRKGFARRMVFYVSFMMMSAFAGLRLKPRPDCILCTSPPIFAAVGGWLVATLRRSRFVLDIRDLWPAAVQAVGIVRKPLVIRCAKVLEAFLYKRSDMILAVTRSFVQTISATAPKVPVHWVPNGTDSELFSPDKADCSLRKSLGLENSFLVLFAGNLGLAQGLDVVVETAVLLPPEDGITFLLLGAGPRERRLKKRVGALGIRNVLFHQQVDVERAAQWLASADALLVTLMDHPIFSSFVPSKLFDYMASGRPILASATGETAEIVRSAGCGVCVEPSSPARLAEAVRWLRAHPEESARLGKLGRRYAQERFERKRIGEGLSDLLLRRFQPVERPSTGRKQPG